MNGVTKHNYKHKGRSVLSIDTSQVKYKGIKYRDLGFIGRRKVDNLVFLQHAKENPIIRYE